MNIFVKIKNLAASIEISMDNILLNNMSKKEIKNMLVWINEINQKMQKYIVILNEKLGRN